MNRAIRCSARWPAGLDIERRHVAEEDRGDLRLHVTAGRHEHTAAALDKRRQRQARAPIEAECGEQQHRPVAVEPGVCRGVAQRGGARHGDPKPRALAVRPERALDVESLVARLTARGHDQHRRRRRRIEHEISRIVGGKSRRIVDDDARSARWRQLHVERHVRSPARRELEGPRGHLAVVHEQSGAALARARPAVGHDGHRPVSVAHQIHDREVRRQTPDVPDDHLRRVADRTFRLGAPSGPLQIGHEDDASAAGADDGLGAVERDLIARGAEPGRQRVDGRARGAPAGGRLGHDRRVVGEGDHGHQIVVGRGVDGVARQLARPLDAAP